MKNIVYLIITSTVILGIGSVVIGLYKADYQAIQDVTNKKNIEKNLSKDGMVAKGKVVMGWEVAERVDFYKEDVTKRIVIELTPARKIDIVGSGVTRENAVNLARQILKKESFIRSGASIHTSFRLNPMPSSLPLTPNPSYDTMSAGAQAFLEAEFEVDALQTDENQIYYKLR